MAFLMITLFVLSLSVLLLELTLTRIFSIILWYDYAFMVISLAFFGLGIGSFLVHSLKDKLKTEQIPTKILQSTMAFAISIPIFLLVIGHVIQSNTSFIYIFYLTSSIPFFFAGISMALIYFIMPKEISKLYFIDLVGAGVATLVLDPFMQGLGAESVLLSIALLTLGSSVMSAFIFVSSTKNKKKESTKSFVIKDRVRVYGIVIMVVSAVLLAININSNVFAIQPGITKGLYYQLAKPAEFQHLSTQWNSFSRIDVTKQTHYQNETATLADRDKIDNTGRSRALASVIIDADADTPVFKW